MLTENSLALAIAVERRGLKQGEHLQVCLWFASEEEVERLDHCPEVWPVSGYEIARHAAGGGIARGGDHIDYSIEPDDPRGSIELARLLLDGADAYAAENMDSPWNLATQEGA